MWKKDKNQKNTLKINNYNLIEFSSKNLSKEVIIKILDVVYTLKFPESQEVTENFVKEICIKILKEDLDKIYEKLN